MAKTRSRVKESTQDLEQLSKALFERVVQAQSDVGNSLQLARRLEAQLLEKERQKQREREQIESRERLRELLEQDHNEQAEGQEGNAPEEAVAEHEVPANLEVFTPEQGESAPAARPATEQKAPRPQQGAAPLPFDKDRPRPARPAAGAQQGPRTGQQFQPRDQRPGGLGPRPAGQSGFGPRPAGQGGFGPRPAGAGGFGAPRPGGPGRPPAAGSTPVKDKASNYDPNKGMYARNYEADKKNKNRRTILKENAPPAAGWDDERMYGRKARPKKAQVRPKIEPIVIEKAIITTEKISIKDLSEKLGKPSSAIIKKLFGMGIMATINHELDFDTVELVALEFGIEVEKQIAKTFEEVMIETAENADTPEAMLERSPVVTIMGHVDHGKTSILDAIRESSVVSGEAGGITQHIGAYMVQCNGKDITFIDTPGHEAFTSMRARGAQVTDIVVLVVAADDGIMPQTIEAISHSQAAKVPIIVAINKMDKPTADPDKIKQQLTEHGLVPEEWGGETICVPVSAKTKEGLNSLLEMILLQSEVLELRANPNRMARGVIIEAQLDKGRGPVATVLIQNGTLKIGDTVVAGTAYGRVRAMMDDKGRKTEQALPSHPVEVLGFSEVPNAGDLFNAVEVDKLSRQVAEERKDKQKADQLKTLSKVSLDDLFNQIAEGQIKELNVIVKADVQGSAEAVKQALEKLSNDEVRVRCVHSGVGAIAESDILLATVSNAIVIGFNVRPNNMARVAMEREKIDVRMYRVIYSAVEDIENAMKGMLAPIYKDVELGQAQVRDVFRVTGVGVIAGCYVQEGKVLRNAKVRVVRDGIVVHEGKINSLKRFKDDAKEVASGYECGIGLDGFNDVKEGDIIEAFMVEEVKR